jgi:single-strand DNA-binding protein
MFQLNTVTLGGNLTRDPELRSTQSGTSICKVGLAVNSRRKDQSGNWVDEPNYFDITIWGRLGEIVAESLQKGSRLAVQGRLKWRQWDATDGSGKRSAVEVVAEACFFDKRADGNGQRFDPESDVPPDTAGIDGQDEDQDAIPF